jgi:hypothetical protein
VLSRWFCGGGRFGGLLTAERIRVEDATDQVRAMLARRDLAEWCLTPEAWREIGVTLVELEPRGAVLPVRAQHLGANRRRVGRFASVPVECTRPTPRMSPTSSSRSPVRESHWIMKVPPSARGESIPSIASSPA